MAVQTESVDSRKLDFRLLFEAVPALCIVLRPDFRIVAASSAYVLATMTTRDDTLGRDSFVVFPDKPGDEQATGVTKLRASLTRVLQNRVPDSMPVQKYD